MIGRISAMIGRIAPSDPGRSDRVSAPLSRSRSRSPAQRQDASRDSQGCRHAGNDETDRSETGAATEARELQVVYSPRRKLQADGHAYDGTLEVSGFLKNRGYNDDEIREILNTNSGNTAEGSKGAPCNTSTSCGSSATIVLANSLLQSPTPLRQRARRQLFADHARVENTSSAETTVPFACRLEDDFSSALDDVLSSQATTMTVVEAEAASQSSGCRMPPFDADVRAGAFETPFLSEAPGSPLRGCSKHASASSQNLGPWSSTAIHSTGSRCASQSPAPQLPPFERFPHLSQGAGHAQIHLRSSSLVPWEPLPAATLAQQSVNSPARSQLEGVSAAGATNAWALADLDLDAAIAASERQAEVEVEMSQRASQCSQRVLDFHMEPASQISQPSVGLRSPFQQTLSAGNVHSPAPQGFLRSPFQQTLSAGNVHSPAPQGFQGFGGCPRGSSESALQFDDFTLLDAMSLMEDGIMRERDERLSQVR